jgi:hypothetical protein
MSGQGRLSVSGFSFLPEKAKANKQTKDVKQ